MFSSAVSGIERECMAFFTPPDPDIHPISESEDLGIMLYDNFDIKTHTPLDTAKGETCIVPFIILISVME